MRNGSKWSNRIIGLAAIGSAFIGLISFIAAIFPFFNGEFLAAGVLLVAAALAFGLLSIAIFSK